MIGKPLFANYQEGLNLNYLGSSNNGKTDGFDKSEWNDQDQQRRRFFSI